MFLWMYDLSAADKGLMTLAGPYGAEEKCLSASLSGRCVNFDFRDTEILEGLNSQTFRGVSVKSLLKGLHEEM